MLVPRRRRIQLRRTKLVDAKAKPWHDARVGGMSEGCGSLAGGAAGLSETQRWILSIAAALPAPYLPPKWRGSCRSSLPQLPYVRELAGDGGRRRHGRAHEVCPAAAALAAFEVAVGGRGAAFAGLELVGVHGEAHGAAG